MKIDFDDIQINDCEIEWYLVEIATVDGKSSYWEMQPALYESHLENDGADSD